MSNPMFVRRFGTTPMIVSEFKVGDLSPTGCKYVENEGEYRWSYDFFWFVAYELTRGDWKLVEEYLLVHPFQTVEVGYKMYELSLSAKYQAQINEENAVQL